MKEFSYFQHAKMVYDVAQAAFWMAKAAVEGATEPPKLWWQVLGSKILGPVGVLPEHAVRVECYDGDFYIVGYSYSHEVSDEVHPAVEYWVSEPGLSLGPVNDLRVRYRHKDRERIAECKKLGVTFPFKKDFKYPKEV